MVKVMAGQARGQRGQKAKYIEAERQGQNRIQRGGERRQGKQAGQEATGKRPGKATGDAELRRGHIDVREVTERGDRTQGPPGTQGTHMGMGINKLTDVWGSTKVSKSKGEGKERELKASRGARTGGQ